MPDAAPAAASPASAAGETPLNGADGEVAPVPPAGAKGTPEPTKAPPEKKRYKVKIDGAEDEIDEDELVRGYQRARSTTQKQQALAAQQKAIKAALEATGPEEWMRLRGVDPEQWTAQYLQKQNEQMAPYLQLYDKLTRAGLSDEEARGYVSRAMDADRIRAEQGTRAEQEKATRAQAERAEAVEKATSTTRTGIVEAMSKYGLWAQATGPDGKPLTWGDEYEGQYRGQPRGDVKVNEAFAQVALTRMFLASQNGVEISPDEAVQTARDEVFAVAKGLINKLPAEALLREFPEAVKKLRQAALSQLNSGSPAQNGAGKTVGERGTASEPGKPLDFNQFFRRQS